ncbi:MAG: STELLO glycosyltransferase family protein [Candidatus Babeliales bacterium]
MKITRILFLIITLSLNAHDKWIVITTINHPTPALKKLAHLQDWHMVVVGDKKTPRDWHLDNCEYLSPERQEELGFAITKLLPWNHYSRKNIGYLYAIQHGAQIIYETDDDSILLDDTITCLPEYTKCPCAKSTTGLVNVYSHFGQPSVWPRGYPLHAILAPNNAIIQAMQNFIPIQQGLINGDTDVDAIFRLTRDEKDLAFDAIKEPLALAKNTLCPFNTQNTVFYQKAFWGLLIPITVSFRVCDIWRGYWVQRLLWDLDAQLCFTRPTTYQDRNAHNIFKDFLDEQDLYTKAEDFASFLRSWQCSEPTFKEHIEKLMQDMIQAKFFKAQEAELLAAWLYDLEQCGYQMPNINNI